MGKKRRVKIYNPFQATERPLNCKKNITSYMLHVDERKVCTEVSKTYSRVEKLSRNQSIFWLKIHDFCYIDIF